LQIFALKSKKRTEQTAFCALYRYAEQNLTLRLRHKIYSSKFVQSCSENCRYRQSAQKNKKKGGTVSKRILSTSHIITNHKKNQASTTGQLTIYNYQLTM
jgi:hypothetical protein